MKKIIFSMLILLIPIGIFAQEERLANVRNNWISGSASLFGAGASLERMLNPHFPVEVHAYANFFVPLVLINLGIGGGIRYYPQGRIFLLDSALAIKHMLQLGSTDMDLELRQK